MTSKDKLKEKEICEKNIRNYPKITNEEYMKLMKVLYPKDNMKNFKK